MAEAHQIRVYIVDDHPYVREMLSQYLEMEEDVAVCGSAEAAEAALDAIPTASPDLVLVDVSLPGLSGIELVERLRDCAPGTVCLMLSGHGERSHMRRAAEAGAKGYVLKGDTSELLTAVRCVASGEHYFKGVKRLA